MNFFFKRNLFAVIFVLIAFSIKSSEITIEKYDHARDSVAIEKILQDHYHYLCYESAGLPAGTTMQYIMSNKYITDVIRIDNKTVGFINYLVNNAEFLTFQFGRGGIVHLLGIDSDYQGHGYGKQLLQHAIGQMCAQYVSSIVINAKIDNTKARSLYEKNGFACVFSYGSDCIYLRAFNVPADKLPQGNIIQRHKKASLALMLGTLGGLIWWKYIY